MSNLLEKINSPEDLRRLDAKELPALAQDIRDFIIETVSKTGGHLASSLGAVELTLALHYVFNTPEDKIVWDVGHQAYTHKLITGRRDKFHTLRQFGGISGFPKRAESIYDVFDTGHSSTSISAALGIAAARDLAKKKYKVIAVIGDGSMTAGLAFEGLNQAGHLDKDLIVVLNDNEMSISPNVGALSSYLSRVMTGEFSTRLRDDVEKILRTIPGIGEQMLKIAKKMEESFKGFIMPGIIFEELGFQYVGPIQGHHFDHLIKTFNNIKKLEKPILVHVVTKKGKGYQPAEEKPSTFHGVGPFDIKTGKIKKDKNRPPSYTEIFSKTLVDLAQKDKKIIAITAAMPEGTGLNEFAKKFPNRFHDVGIAEQHGVTFSAGLALEGFKPVVAIYSTFLQRAYDQILHDVCLQNLHITFAIDRAGIVGDDGATHQGLFDYSYLRHLPNMVIMSPKDENEFQHMLSTAVKYIGPIAVRYPRGAGVGVSLDNVYKDIEIGKGEILRKGDKIAILAIGTAVYPSLEAADKLALEGIKVWVINARFVKPLDISLIENLAGKVDKIVTIEENILQGGFGSAVLEALEEKGLYNIKVKRMGIPDVFVEHGHQELLRKKYGLDSEGIVKTVRELKS